jgi:hypothetical protein
MLTRPLIATIVACLSLLAVLAVAAAAGSGDQSTALQLDKAKRATARFKDLAKAEAAGYVRAGECTTGRGGAMACIT